MGRKLPRGGFRLLIAGNAENETLLYADDGFPYGILVDPNGNIVAFNVRPETVVEMIAGEK